MRERTGSRHVSVKDVAARSGVSFQTTSKVLNGGGSVSELTRARILQAASDLGYVPNLQARSLVMQRTQTIGVITSDFSDHNLSRVLVGAEQEARRQDYGVIVSSIEPEGSGTEYALPAMMERRVDGILLAAPQLEEDMALEHVLDRRVPAVSLTPVPGGGVSMVGVDDVEIGAIATRHLLERGHRAIAVVTGVRGRHDTEKRLRGYREALQRAGVAFDDQLVEEGGRDSDGAMRATQRLLARRPDINAVFAQNDMLAVGVLAALRNAGRRVPDECAVVGCDDIDIAPYTAPPLTTIHVPFYEIGSEAMRLLLGAVMDGAATERGVVLPVRLIVRGSTGQGAAR
ncbi:MAG TPA: LacI family DNA-binding transcriptional regulator [Candidatus Dormibacteraeota bacterium]|nr:LacI family DNA-binding transcriptional regulator [Candidatus Dormibacteraeota bacterium]